MLQASPAEGDWVRYLLPPGSSRRTWQCRYYLGWRVWHHSAPIPCFCTYLLLWIRRPLSLGVVHDSIPVHWRQGEGEQLSDCVRIVRLLNEAARMHANGIYAY